MKKQGLLSRIRKRNFFLLPVLLFPFSLHASFIEATLGTAVVNDATATFYNPAALTLLKNPQAIALGSVGNVSNRFIGQSQQVSTGFIQSGSATTRTNYFLPSFYFGVPATEKITFGMAVVSNFLSKSLDDNSILRYSQSSNNIQDIDFVPAIGVKLNEIFSIGAGVNLSYASFLSQPTLGFPSLNVPDTESRNETDATGVGGSVGFLLRPAKGTLVGFNYRSAITYQFSGKSIFESSPQVVSNHYSFDFWTPARSVLSVNQFLTQKFGLIGTVQRVQWSIFDSVNVHGIATRIGTQPSFVNATLPYHLHDTWVVTLGTLYQMTPKWMIRLAGTYNQSPGNGNYQIDNGDSIVFGGSVGYEINKNFTLDGSYAHAFIQNQTIQIANSMNSVSGVNKSNLNAASIKLTVNFC